MNINDVLDLVKKEYKPDIPLYFKEEYNDDFVDFVFVFIWEFLNGQQRYIEITSKEGENGTWYKTDDIFDIDDIEDSAFERITQEEVFLDLL